MPVQKAKRLGMTRLLALVAMLLCALSLLAPWACRSAVAAAGDDGSQDGYNYTVNDDDATVTITKYTGDGGSVAIPATLGGYKVTAIGDDAFYECTSLTSLTLSENVESVGVDAFRGCDKLSVVLTTSALKAVGDSAFEDCTTLATVVLAYGLQTIGDSAFEGCASLSAVSIPDSVTAIGEGAFLRCTSLASVIVQEGAAAGGLSIGDYAFYGCTSLASATLNGVKSIGFEAFWKCSALKTLTLAEGLTTIGEEAFEGCGSLTGLTVPASVTSIGQDAFLNCTSLSSITFTEAAEGTGGGLSIGESAFKGCTGLTSLAIPSNVTSIGDSAFQCCTGLTSLTFAEGTAHSTSIGYCAFNACTGLTSVSINNVATIGANAFDGCSALASLSLGSGLTTIGEEAFKGCVHIQEVTLPEGLTCVGNGAFNGCKRLTGIAIPDSVTSIGSFAFSECTRLATLSLGSGLKTIGGYAFWGCKAISSALTFPDGLTSIGDYAFYNCSSITNRIAFPDSVTNIGEGAFKGCVNIAGINLSRSLTCINKQSFYACKKITDVYVPSSVKTIGEDAFGECMSLASARLAEGVESIGEWAFDMCHSLTSVTLPSTLTSIADNAFYDCSKAIGFHGAHTSTEHAYAQGHSNVTEYHQVFFYSDGGSSVDERTVTCGQLTSDVTPTKAGYIFKGWYTDEARTQAFDLASDKVEDDLSLYPKWVPKQPTVTFVANGGTEVATKTVDNGATIDQPECTKADSVLDCWCSDKALTQPVEFPLTVTDDVTLYAKWASSHYTVTFMTNGGTDLSPMTVDNGSAFSQPECTKAGNTLVGWYIDEEFATKYDFQTRVLSDLTLYAKWAPDTSTVTFEANGGTEVKSETVEYGTTIDQPECTKQDCVLVGWFYDEKLTEPVEFPLAVTGDLTLYAKWAPATLTVTFVSNGGSEVASQTVGYNATSAQPECTRDDYTVEGWYTDTTLMRRYDFQTPVTGNLTLYAKWTCDYTYVKSGDEATVTGYNGSKTELSIPAQIDGLDVVAIGTGAFSGKSAVTSVSIPQGVTSIGEKAFANCTSLGSIAVPEGVASIGDEAFRDCTVLATASLPSTLKSVGADAFTGCTAVAFHGPHTDAAHSYASDAAHSNVTEYHQVTFDTAGGSGLEAKDVVCGQAVGAVEATKADCALAGWYVVDSQGAETAFDPAKDAVTDDLTLHAKWAAATFTVTFVANGGSKVAAQTVAYGGKAAQPTCAKSGYELLGWYADAALTSKYDFNSTVTGDLTLYAKWSPVQLTVTFVANGGSEVAAQTVAYGGKAAQPTCAKAGSTLEGWYTDRGLTGKYDFNSTVTGHLTLYAKWSPVQLTVTFVANGGTEVAAQTVAYGGKAAQPTCAKSGYELLGWYADAALTSKYDFNSTVTGNLALYAAWKQAVPTTFSDVLAGTWYYDWVTTAARRDLMSGYKDAAGEYTGLFGPEDQLTRAQVATVIWRMAGSPSVSYTGRFPDVAGNEWYTTAIEWCANRGIVTGYTGGPNTGRFLPDGYVTREELATMVYRYAKSVGTVESGVPTANFDRCRDTASVSDWSREAMVWCAAAGVITGKELSQGYYLDPQAGATRAEAAKIFVQTDRLTKYEIDPYSLDELVEQGAVEEAQALAQETAPTETTTDAAAETEEATFDDVTPQVAADGQASGEPGDPAGGITKDAASGTGAGSAETNGPATDQTADADTTDENATFEPVTPGDYEETLAA